MLGDVRTRLGELPTASVDCVITSPPYFGVRNYGHHGQLGAEHSIEAWVAELRTVCREIARVLRPSGSLWLNVGDGYARHPREGATTKSLLLGPSRLALALLADGWILRNQVVWAKSNPMPSSIGDRLTATHETIYFFVRSRSYYFNLDAIRRPLVSAASPGSGDAQRIYPPVDARLTGRAVSTNDGLGKLKATGQVGHPLGKNPGDIWKLATAGFRGAHFAVFPASLVQRPLLAGCPERVCTACGDAWQRALERKDSRLLAIGELQPTCRCAADSQPGIVLDPFFGSGTVGVVAQQHGRDWLGIELNSAYVALATERLGETQAATPNPTASRAA